MHDTIRRLIATLIAFLPIAAAPLWAQSLRVEYREAANVFEILDHVSNWWPDFVEPEYRTHWAKAVGFEPGDSALFAQYTTVRNKYFDRSGQGNNRPRRDGSGLFSDRRTLTADPLAAAFYRSTTTSGALEALRGQLTNEELTFLTSFYAHFRPRLTPWLRETQTATAASRAATARTLQNPQVAAYMRTVGRWLRSDSASFTALYVWWPDTLRTTASPSGNHLILRVRPTRTDTINSADVVAHEAIHVLLATVDSTRQQAISASVMDGCPLPIGMRRLTVLEEPIATVLGNMEFRRRFMAQRFQWRRQWYGDDWVDLQARLLFPVITNALDGTRTMDAEFGKDAAALCSVALRARSKTNE